MDRSDQPWRQNLIDALLHELDSDSAGQHDHRVRQLLQRLELEAGAESALEAASLAKPIAQSWRRPSLWVKLLAACAAALLLVLIPVFMQEPSAVATVQKSLLVTQQRVPRHYQLDVALQLEGQAIRQIEGDLYVQGAEFLAVRIPAMLNPKREAWAGHNQHHAWVVPAYGPVMVGDQIQLGHWLLTKPEVSTPYLHVVTLLNRMVDSYDLQVLPKAYVPGTSGVDGSEWYCRHVRATRKSTATGNLPATLELWAESDTGVVKRLEADWDLGPDQVGRKSIALHWVSDTDVQEEWFEHSSHHLPRRRVIDWKSGSNR